MIRGDKEQKDRMKKQVWRKVGKSLHRDERMMNVKLSERWRKKINAGGEAMASCREQKMRDTEREKEGGGREKGKR